MTSEVSINNKRIARNTFFLYGRKILTMLIAIYSSRVLLQYLGIDDFGLYGLVGSIVVIFTSLKSTFASSVQRFLNVNKKDQECQNRIFCVGMEIHIMIALLFMFLSGMVGFIFLPNLNIHIDKLIVAQNVLLFTILSASVAIITVPYDALIISNERFNALAIISIVDALLRLGAIFLLEISPISRVVFYAILLFGIAIINIILTRFYCNKTFGEISKFRYVKDRILFEKMTGFAGWNFFGNIAYYLTSEGVNLILNVFGGIAVNASRTIAYQVKNALQALVSDITVAFQPQSMMVFKDDKCRFYQLQFLATKIRFTVCVTIGFPIFLFVPELLQIWLGTEPENAAVFIRCVLLFVIIRCWHDAIDITFKSAARMKEYQLCEMFIMLFNLPISLSALILGLPLYAVFIIMSVIELINLVSIMFLAKKKVGFEMTSYISKVILPSVLVICILSILYICYSYSRIFLWNWLERGILCVFCIFVSLGLIWSILFDSLERGKIIFMLRHR